MVAVRPSLASDMTLCLELSLLGESGEVDRREFGALWGLSGFAVGGGGHVPDGRKGMSDDQYERQHRVRISLARSALTV